MAKPKFKLTLFVKTFESGNTLSLLYKALEFHAYADYELDIVDVLKEPPRATAHNICQTPTLMMHTECGEVFMTSDLADIQKVRLTFGFKLKH